MAIKFHVLLRPMSLEDTPRAAINNEPTRRIRDQATLLMLQTYVSVLRPM